MKSVVGVVALWLTVVAVVHAHPTPTGTCLPAGPRVAFTFDDGPRPGLTPAILATLARHEAHATFFLLGNNAQAHPGLVRAIGAAGHEIGNHTWSHPDLRRLSVESRNRQVASTQDVLDSLVREPVTRWRPPYGAVPVGGVPWARAHGLAMTLWTIDTLDWQNPSAGTEIARVVPRVHNHSVVLFHDHSRTTQRVLDEVLSGVQARGYQVVSVRELSLPTCRREPDAEVPPVEPEEPLPDSVPPSEGAPQDVPQDVPQEGMPTEPPARHAVRRAQPGLTRTW